MKYEFEPKYNIGDNVKIDLCSYMLQHNTTDVTITGINYTINDKGEEKFLYNSRYYIGIEEKDIIEKVK